MRSILLPAVRISTVVGLLVLAPAFPSVALPTVPGASTSVYALIDLTNLTQCAIAPDDTIYAGYDPDGGRTPTRLKRIAPGGSPVSDFGERAINDPDALIVDEDGSVGGEAGSLLVGSGWEGLLRISTNGTVTTLVSADYSTFGNPDQFVVDNQGRLLWPGCYEGMSDSSYAVATYSSGQVVFLYSISYFTQMWLDGLGRMLIYGYGAPRLYSAEGAQLSWPYGDLRPILLGQGDFWRTDLYAIDASGKLLEVDPDGVTTVMGTGFENCALQCFGRDGSLYVSDSPNSRILRVKPQVAGLTIQMSAVELSWPTRADKSYQVQYRSALTTNQWSDLGAPIAGNGGTRCLNESTRGFSQRFYRVIELP